MRSFSWAKYLSLFFLFLTIVLSYYLFRRYSAEDLRDFLSSLGPLAALVYLGLYTLLPILFFPVVVLTVAGGMLFGLWQGTLLSLLGAMLNTLCMFLLGRLLLRELLRSWLQRQPRAALAEKLLAQQGQEALLGLFLVRLIPLLPYALVNFLYGTTELRLGSYLLISLLGYIPATLVYVNLGAQVIAAEQSSLYLAAALCVGFTVLSVYLGRRYLAKNQSKK